MQKGDTVISVSSMRRGRELLAIADQKYLAIYRCDMGKIFKLYSINHQRYEIREFINQNSVFFYTKDFLYFVARKNVYKLNLGSNILE
jgi:hypothetical protein